MIFDIPIFRYALKRYITSFFFLQKVFLSFVKTHTVIEQFFWIFI